MQTWARLTLASEAPSSVLTARSLLTSACRKRESVTQPGAPQKQQGGGCTGGSQDLWGQGARNAHCPEENLLSTHSGSTHTEHPHWDHPVPGTSASCCPPLAARDAAPRPPQPSGVTSSLDPPGGQGPPQPQPSSEALPGRGQPRGEGNGDPTRTLLPSSMMTTSFCAYSWISVSQACGDSGAASGGSTPHPAQPPGRAGKTFFNLILLLLLFSQVGTIPE